MSLLTIIQGATVYAPEYLGKKDIFLAGRQIIAIEDHLAFHGDLPEIRYLNASHLMLIPGLIDQHVHMAGGGGEGGFHYRTPEISLSHITTSGVTTAIGVLGTDGITRSTQELLAKANALDHEGITTYIYSGAYQVPTRTITGMPRNDLVLIDKVIGIGEIAIADSRSSHPSDQELAELASEARVGGLLAGKAGVLHLHVGDDDTHLSIVRSVLAKTELPYSLFVPTHCNRNPGLFEDAKAYYREGGYVDITSGITPNKHDTISIKPSQAIATFFSDFPNLTRLTMSSDSNGSSPIFNDQGKLISMGIGSMHSLFDELRDVILTERIPIDTALSLVTKNVARLLKLRHKGRIALGLDADLVLVDDSWMIHHVFAKGRWMVKDGKPIVYGTFENMPSIPGSPDANDTTSQKPEGENRFMIPPSDHDPDDFADLDERTRHRRFPCC